jgi:outer membrane murein-binding lipoprotein Lpp
MQGRRRVLGALAAALVALLLVAGCGNDQAKRDTAYVDRVNAAQTDFARTINRLNGRVSATSTPSEDRATLRGYTAAIDGVVAKLRRIEPPSSVAPLHVRLIADMSAYGARVRAAAASVRSRSTSRLLDAQQRLLDATDMVSRQINATIGAINRKLGS